MSKLHRMLEKLSRALGRKPPEHASRKQLRKLLKKLRQRQRELEHARKHAHSEAERKRLEREIAVLRAQRRKGARLYRDMEE